MSKKYFWLKLYENFFEREEIKIIENMENGKDYIIFYLKLLLRSVKSDGLLRFKEILPYSPQMLSIMTNTNIDTVRSAIKLFSEFGMMEIWDDGTFFMVETVNMIGSEGESAARMRQMRAKQKQVSHCDNNVQKSDTEIEIEKQIELQQQEQKSRDVVVVFKKNGIDIIPVIKKFPTVLNNFTSQEITKIAETLRKKEDEGKIKNPPGLLISDPEKICKSILRNNFYPDVPKSKKQYNDEGEIFLLPLP